MKAVLKAVLAVAILAVSAFAQNPAAKAAAEDICGPKTIKFDVKNGAADPAPQIQRGKALVYVIEDIGGCPGCSQTFTDNALTRIGMDGAWIGANQGNSYFFLAVDPGEHHLCVNWQSRIEVRSRAFAMANFTAQAGAVYYFLERIFPGNADFYFDLDSVNSDEGKYLVASYSFSVSHPKK
jgi:hypothetical protein